MLDVWLWSSRLNRPALPFDRAQGLGGNPSDRNDSGRGLRNGANDAAMDGGQLGGQERDRRRVYQRRYGLRDGQGGRDLGGEGGEGEAPGVAAMQPRSLMVSTVTHLGKVEWIIRPHGLAGCRSLTSLRTAAGTA